MAPTGSGAPASSRRGAARLDLVAGILLGLALGVAIAYLLVIVVGGSRDASQISTPSPPAETRTGEGASPQP